MQHVAIEYCENAYAYTNNTIGYVKVDSYHPKCPKITGSTTNGGNCRNGKKCGKFPSQ
uniref:Uncharacterized protein n=1 Tax=Anguilla anguilla TaxID=7936 RepID=A0A0E9X999_ANGAN